MAGRQRPFSLIRLGQRQSFVETKNRYGQLYAFYRQGDFKDGLAIADILLQHSHDLIQKAVGWLLREIGKKDKQTLTDFLAKRYNRMPRTALRYAIERFPEEERKSYLIRNFKSERPNS